VTIHSTSSQVNSVRYTVTLFSCFDCQEPFFPPQFCSSKSCFLYVITFKAHHSFHMTKLTIVAKLCNYHHHPFCDFFTFIIFSGSCVPYFYTVTVYYLLTAWCRVLLEKQTGLQLVKKFPAFHRTRRFITALTSVRHLSLSWASPIQSIYPHPTSWRYSYSLCPSF